MNTNTGSIKSFENSESIPKGYVRISDKTETILSKYTRKERRHLWATYSILKISGRVSFDEFIQTLERI